MKICVISDTHNQLDKIDIPQCDLLLHCGDLTMQGYEFEVIRFLDEFRKKKARHKVFIAGNHDFLFEHKPEKAKELLLEYPDIHYLEDSSVVIEGIKIWGSPYQPWFHNWAFNFSPDADTYRKEAQELWDQIPDDTDIVITHGPAYGIQDKVAHLMKGEEDPHVGCPYLLDRIVEIRPRLHCFGHIHEAYGQQTIWKLSDPPRDPITYINASSVDLSYNKFNPVVVIETKTEDFPNHQSDDWTWPGPLNFV